MSNVQTIQSEDITVGALFNDYYIVPSFQREFVWGDTEVSRLLQDIYAEFMGGDQDPTSEYFIGSMVVCPVSDNLYEIIDGQQRMTTIYLFMCAVRDHLAAAEAAPIQALEQMIAAVSVDSSGHDVFRYRVTLQYEDSHDLLEGIAARKDTALLAQIESTRSVDNILNAYQFIRDFLKNEFGEDHESLRKFYAFVTRNVKLIRVRTISISRALKVFETINDRGVGLNSMDLLKNLMFMQAARDDFDNLNDKWKELIDTLYQANEKPLRFLRYFIFSEYSVERLREDQIYQWFTRNAAICGYDMNPFGFIDQLIDSAEAYALFVGGNNKDGTPNRYLDNIRRLSGAARQHLILLLAGKHLPTESFTELARHLENLFFAYIIAREPTREFERTFAQWAPELRQVKSHDELVMFLERSFRPAKRNLAARFTLAFDELYEGSVQKYRIRYILAKLTQHINEQAWGSTGPQAHLSMFMGGDVEIEHILPQTPSPEVAASFDKKDEIEDYIYSLGNLTLVEKTINCSVGNGLFDKKRGAYEESNFLLTKSLARKVKVGLNTAVDRAVKDLPLFEEWTSKSIDRRQELLASLARQVWDMPSDDEVVAE